MHNHTHTVARADKPQALAWTDEEVIARWTALYRPTPLVARHLAGARLSLHLPLSTLNHYPYEQPPMTRGFGCC
ncbi:MAG: hypothetical protein KZQ95_22030 [Candidatus Thiodiazotropha sp. (ex Epidulcina cf. delphinae)]|nr:hypothetical protein [Candidatus Thiodiazotropha sp. (ex Epidulcina cf. delphinae)]